MFEPSEPLIKVNAQLVNFAVPSVDVRVKGILMIKFLLEKLPEKSNTSPDCNLPEIMLPLELK